MLFADAACAAAVAGALAPSESPEGGAHPLTLLVWVNLSSNAPPSPSGSTLSADYEPLPGVEKLTRQLEYADCFPTTGAPALAGAGVSHRPAIPSGDTHIHSITRVNTP